MTSMQLIVLITVIVVGAIIYGRTRVRRTGHIEIEQHLKARQVEIQSVIDALGEALKNPSTTASQGEAAAQSALADLRQLNPDGSLDPLIADTEEYVAEWRAAQQSA